jgi:hypothetical protein
VGTAVDLREVGDREGRSVCRHGAFKKRTL